MFGSLLFHLAQKLERHGQVSGLASPLTRSSTQPYQAIGAETSRLLS